MELKEKCEDMADFYLQVFEKYWEKIEEDYPTEEVIRLALYSHNLDFVLAFAITHDMVDISGLSESAIQGINKTYDLMVAVMGDLPEVVDARRNYKWWDETYAKKGKYLEGTNQDKQLLEDLDQGFIWSMLSENSGNVYVNGYFPDAYHYILSEVPCNAERGSIWVATDIYITCQQCHGDGSSEDGGTCSSCEGDGTIFQAVD